MPPHVYLSTHSYPPYTFFHRLTHVTALGHRLFPLSLLRFHTDVSIQSPPEGGEQLRNARSSELVFVVVCLPLAEYCVLFAPLTRFR